MAVRSSLKLRQHQIFFGRYAAESSQSEAKRLRTESNRNRLNPEPKFDQEAAPAEKKYKDAAMDP